MIRAAIVVIGVTLLTLTGAATDQWPQFRGAGAGVIPDDPALPETWSETENVVWKTTIPGLGWSSPIVWDDHIFLTSAISSGHEKPPAPGLYDEHDHVKAAASQRWVVYDVAFKTGKIRWERELSNARPPLLRNREERGNWSTPFVWENELRTEVVTAGTVKVRSYDLDGKQLWELKGMTTLTIPSPFAQNGLVYISSGYPGALPRPVYAIRPARQEFAERHAVGHTSRAARQPHRTDAVEVVPDC